MKIDRWIAVALGVALAGGFVLSQRPHPPHLPPAAAETGGPRKVSTAKVSTEPVQVFAEAVGTVRSRRQTQIASRVLAEVKEIRSQPGDTVKAGDALVVLDSLDLQARVEQAEANRRSFDESLKEAQTEFDRKKNLLEKEAVTQQEYDLARFQLEATRARLVAAEKALEEARIQLGYANIAAPFDGIVYEKHADPGDLAVPGKPILGLYDPEQLRLEALVEESLLWKLRVKDTLRVEIDVLRQSAVGQVSEAVPAVDPVTRTGTVKIDLPGGLDLRPGMFGRAMIPVSSREATVVPAAAVARRGQLELAFTLGPGTRPGESRATMRLVRIGPPLEPGESGEGGADRLEVLAGLRPGDVVIASDLASLRDGDSVVASDLPAGGGSSEGAKR